MLTVTVVETGKLTGISALTGISDRRHFHTLTSDYSHHLALARTPCYYDRVIRSFKNAGTEDIFYGKNTKAARRVCPQNLWRIAGRKLDQLDSVDALKQLRIPPGNQLEVLSGNRAGQSSIRINEQYRICFTWAETEPDQVEIVDYH